MTHGRGSMAIARIGPRRSVNLGRRRHDLRWTSLIVPTLVIDHTELAMRQGGTVFEETFAVWAGTIADDLAVVSTVVFPAVETSATHGHISAHVVARIHETLDDHDLVALAQIHSHPGDAFLSKTDRLAPIAAQAGFVSIVIARFGFIDMADVSAWSVHEFLGHGEWREFDHAEISRRIIVDPSLLVIE